MHRRDVTAAVGFPSTQWSLVGRAGGSSSDQRREALGALLRRYLPALRAHLVWARGLPGDRADDFVQGFVADRVIEQNLLSRAEQAKGRFRSFLLGALNHYVASQFRRDGARKRRPAAAVLDIDDLPDVSSADAEPSWQFTLAWAREVVEEAKRRTEAHCNTVERPDLWLVFTERVLRPAAEHTPPPPHGQVAGDLKLAGSKAASNLLVTSKRLFARTLRAVVSEYAADEAEVDEEIDDLMRALARHR